MLAADNIELETIKDKTNEISTKKPKRNKKTIQSTESNGVVENGNGSLTEPAPTKLPKHSKSKKSDTSTRSKSSDPSADDNINQIPQINERNSTNAPRFEQIELTTVTDEEDDDHKLDKKRGVQLSNSVLTEPSTMVQSYTSGDNDVIEIHEFSLADIDAYLDIYFETVNNRLRHFVGEDEQLQQFRLATKNRITSDANAREYQNVLLGKMNGEVVAAVTLSFPGERTTIANDNILPQANSCLTAIRRWTVRNANYIPTNIEECYIEMIGVKKAFRNHGIGAAMLECVEHFARQAGANLLTVHINGEQLRNYFQRFGFGIDHSDNSGIWKWIVERQSTQKLSKTIPPSDGDNDYPMDNTSSYFNESMVESEAE